MFFGFPLIESLLTDVERAEKRQLVQLAEFVVVVECFIY